MRLFPPFARRSSPGAPVIGRSAHVAQGPTGEAPRSVRVHAIDVARGLALIAMASYHFSWDLANARLVDWGVASDPLWRGYAMAIAATFLFLSGLSLQLANRSGFDLPRFAGRLLRIAGAAALVSVATYLVFPDAWVFFGILHMMVVGSLIGQPLVRLPPFLLLLLAAVAGTLPLWAQSAQFDGLPLAITGLAVSVPTSNDFVPIFPWLAPLLVGLAAGRLLVDRPVAPSPPPRRRLTRLVALLGRWSLLFYLVHQPLLFGLAEGLGWLLPVDPVVERGLFVRDCVNECAGVGADAGYCRAFCGCVAESIDGTPIWQSRTIDTSYDALISTAAASCRRASLPDSDDAPGGLPDSDDDD
jgi:uncharacterized membrane protein